VSPELPRDGGNQIQNQIAVEALLNMRNMRSSGDGLSTHENSYRSLLPLTFLHLPAWVVTWGRTKLTVQYESKSRHKTPDFTPYIDHTDGKMVVTIREPLCVSLQPGSWVLHGEKVGKKQGAVAV
jgi:hypothetical protein